MSEHPILKKLKLKEQSPILILNPPEEFQAMVSEIPADVHHQPTAKYGFIHVFVKNADEVTQFAVPAARSLDGDGILWISYPKKSSKKYQSDISRDHGWQELGELGYEPVTQVSIDEDWSALRFRKVAYIKKFTRKSAISRQGQERIS